MSEIESLYITTVQKIEEELKQDSELEELQNLLTIAKGQDLTNYINTALKRIFEIQENKLEIVKKRFFIKGYLLGKHNNQ